MAIIGYARVSRPDQDLRSQVDLLIKAGCIMIFSEKASGSNINRKELQSCLDFLKTGDTLIVNHIDRLSRIAKDTHDIDHRLKEKGVKLLILTDPDMETETANGKLIFGMKANIAEHERNLTIERTKRGMASARARGNFGGPRFKLTFEQMIVLAKMHADISNSVATIARTFKISKWLVHRYVDLAKAAGVYPGHVVNIPIIPERMARK